MTRELLLGCGNSREKKLYSPDTDSEWHDLVTLDISPACEPHVVHDLNVLPYPFQDEEFDSIYAFEVLEHLGRQGDADFFFAQFSELYRIIKPDGLLFGSCPLPNSPWAFGDPSHTRIVSVESFAFLDQSNYAKHVGKTTMTDFRSIYKANWVLSWAHQTPEGLQMFALKAVKE